MNGITVNCKELKDFSVKLAALNGAQKEAFMTEASKDLAGRLLALVIPATPVGKSTTYKAGKYTKGKRKGQDVMRTSQMGGALRRGWTAKPIEVYKIGRSFRVNLVNPTHYASYVEIGHKQTPGRYVPAIGKRLKASWVEGQHFLELSENELKKIAPEALEKKLEAFLRRVF